MARKARTKNARENRLIDLATDLAEKRLLEGTATSSEIVHFLKLGSEREKLEREKLESENKLLRAKTEAVETSKEVKELYVDAIKAMGLYTGESEI